MMSACAVAMGNGGGGEPAEPLRDGPSILRGEVRAVEDFTIVEAFRRQAREDAERRALWDEDGFLSYGELNQRTNQIARLLRERGVGPGVFVGVGLRRSARLVEALLAVLKAGGAYVPLDPDYPEARLSQMLGTVRPRIVLTLDSLTRHFPLPAGTEFLRLDKEDVAGAEDFPCPAGPDDLLYAIFTSGSTGQPKAATVTRRGFANLLEWYCSEFHFGPEDRMLPLSSPSFDFTQKSFLAPLVTGGLLVCAPSGPFDLTKISALIADHGVTVLACTPSAFYPLADWLTGPSSIRLAALGGEPISKSRVRAWIEESDSREIANTYGPTECTDISGFHRMNRETFDDFAFVPLGRPLPNVQLAVMDDSGRPAPRGEAGELWIAGMGVGPGYLGDAERTAEKFVPNPLPEILDGPRVYRTGDRARLLPKGILEFLGRADYQVKVRGHRVELLEIESALGEYPGMREVVVVLTEGGSNLAAFFIPSGPGSPTPQELHDHLAARLPEFMIPGRFEALREFPLTSNGKVDRRKLAASKVGSPSSSVTGNAEGVAAALLDLWAKALGHADFGLNDNFFDLGGDSIQLATIHAGLVKFTGRPVPITDLFEYPSIRSLAAHLEGKSRAPSGSALRAQRQRQALAARRPTRS